MIEPCLDVTAQVVSFNTGGQPTSQPAPPTWRGHEPARGAATEHSAVPRAGHHRPAGATTGGRRHACAGERLPATGKGSG